MWLNLTEPNFRVSGLISRKCWSHRFLWWWIRYSLWTNWLIYIPPGGVTIYTSTAAIDKYGVSCLVCQELNYIQWILPKQFIPSICCVRKIQTSSGKKIYFLRRGELKWMMTGNNTRENTDRRRCRRDRSIISPKNLVTGEGGWVLPLGVEGDKKTKDPRWLRRRSAVKSFGWRWDN